MASFLRINNVVTLWSVRDQFWVVSTTRQLRTLDLLPQNRRTALVNTMHLKNMLRQINPKS